MSQPFSPPAVNISDPVLFHPWGTGPGAPAFVTAVEGRAVDLVVIQNGTSRVQQSVRYIDDPDLRDKDAVRADGGWSFPLYTKRLDELERTVADLQRKLQEPDQKGKNAAK